MIILNFESGFENKRGRLGGLQALNAFSCFRRFTSLECLKIFHCGVNSNSDCGEFWAA